MTLCYIVVSGNSQIESGSGGYKVVGDNIDKNVKPRYLRINKRTQSLHYFNSYAVKDHIKVSCQQDTPSCDRLVLNKSVILPDREDNVHFFNNCVVLVSRILVDYIPFFGVFKEVVTRHIEHDQSEAMQHKSTVVHL